MSYSKYSGRGVSLLAVLPLILSAQSVRDNVIPLKNWDTPLYWHPNPAETTAANPVPQIQPVDDVPRTPLTFVGMTPCRLVDTRGAAVGFDGNAPFSGGPGPIAAQATVPFPVLTNNMNTTPAPCGPIPLGAAAYSFNVTVVPVTTAGTVYVEIWPDGTPAPSVSTIDDPQGAVVANSAIVAAGTPNGGINVFNYGPGAINVIIDMNGYFVGPTSLSGNTGLGTGTLVNNTSGSENTASGLAALTSNTTGSYNTASGADALYSNTTGANNTASGLNALYSNTTGGSNTASGVSALSGNTTGTYNTASGAGALLDNVIGSNNTAFGFQALLRNTVSNNTAVGYEALLNSTTGYQNTASGGDALQTNTTGFQNTANGFGALLGNTVGIQNTASGYYALSTSTAGNYNTASGFSAMLDDTTGSFNTASGMQALTANTTGSNNTVSGFGALAGNTIGGNNIGIGFGAGNMAPAANSDSIYIGASGAAVDLPGTIQIGTQGAQAGGTFIAGIYGTVFGGGLEVFVNNNGQLSTLPSSSRFKEQITDMGDSSSKLLQLRPVNFYYKPEFDDGSRQLQYGLIAEDVAKVYPEMVAYANDGQVLSVKYQLLAPMLLNELQKQVENIRSLEDRLAALEAGLANRSPGGTQPVQ
jgi:trimeric autotransporter adhesin